MNPIVSPTVNSVILGLSAQHALEKIQLPNDKVEEDTLQLVKNNASSWTDVENDNSRSIFWTFSSGSEVLLDWINRGRLGASVIGWVSISSKILAKTSRSPEDIVLALSVLTAVDSGRKCPAVNLGVLGMTILRKGSEFDDGGLLSSWKSGCLDWYMLGILKIWDGIVSALFGVWFFSMKRKHDVLKRDRRRRKSRIGAFLLAYSGDKELLEGRL